MTSANGSARAIHPLAVWWLLYRQGRRLGGRSFIFRDGLEKDQTAVLRWQQNSSRTCLILDFEGILLPSKYLFELGRDHSNQIGNFIATRRGRLYPYKVSQVPAQTDPSPSQIICTPPITHISTYYIGAGRPLSHFYIPETILPRFLISVLEFATPPAVFTTMSNSTGFFSESTQHKIADYNSIMTSILTTAGVATLLGHAVLRTLTGKSLLKLFFGIGDDQDRARIQRTIENAEGDELDAFERTAERVRATAPNNQAANMVRTAVARRRQSVSPAPSQHGSHHSSSSHNSRGGSHTSGYGRGGSQSGYGRGGH